MHDSASTQLNQLLYKYAGEDGYAFHSVHGFYTALAINPFDINVPERNEIFFGQGVALTSDDARLLEDHLEMLSRRIDRQFNEEEGFSLSCEEYADPDDEDLMDWCCGFVQAHILNEQNWFLEHEQEVSELLLPVMLGSRLFDEKPEFATILEDDKLTEIVCGQIPEVLMELYLLFNSPEDTTIKPTTPKQGKQVRFNKHRR